MAKTVHEYDPLMDEIFVQPGSIDETLDFPKIFGNDNPVEIEIGCGKGRFILAESKARPSVNFIAIERSKKIIRIGASRATKLRRTNLAFLNLDADMVVKLLVKPNSIQAYHVYFPDPWPKGRHRKRRLFNPRLLQKMAETLLPQGILKLKSDHADYYNDANERIITSSLFQRVNEDVSYETVRNINEAGEEASHYEIKWRKEARPIHSSEYQIISKS
ncbi:MAG: tRNA (guanosine(46)-N7)-methyltransferase TrmB [Candidatus Hinthialibacter antarcticus]|nr:tRNA (guanosine(46)-N7)-methyltransferase TrmB [Candidatus Hinthialibacter antarcticus]